MAEQNSTESPPAPPAGGPAQLDAALRELIDVDGKAVAVAKRAEQVINSPGTSPALRQKLIDAMAQVVASSDNVHRFLAETLAPVLERKPSELSTAAPAPKRRKPKVLRVRL